MSFWPQRSGTLVVSPYILERTFFFIYKRIGVSEALSGLYIPRKHCEEPQIPYVLEGSYGVDTQHSLHLRDIKDSVVLFRGLFYLLGYRECDSEHSLWEWVLLRQIITFSAVYRESTDPLCNPDPLGLSYSYQIVLPRYPQSSLLSSLIQSSLLSSLIK